MKTVGMFGLFINAGSLSPRESIVKRTYFGVLSFIGVVGPVVRVVSGSKSSIGSFCRWSGVTSSGKFSMGQAFLSGHL